MDANLNRSDFESPDRSPRHADEVAVSGSLDQRAGKKSPEAATPVTSHLTSDEPVTQAEIDLVLHFLRDTIGAILRNDE